MGIKQLNKLIRLYTPLETINIVKLNGKTISIDIMIYIYKFMASNTLLENMYMLCILLKHHKITPIFVFDGKKPVEKREELNRRREKRKEAWEKYDNIIKNTQEKELKTEKIQKELSKLKRQCVKIKASHISDVKNLLTYLGLKYIIAKGEADKLCAELVIHKKAYACMSDDMDLFMYGCPIVLRLFNIQTKTTIVYKLPVILDHLKMNLHNFQIMCVLSGTDYNIEYNKNNIFKIYKNYTYFIRHFKNQELFLDWVIKQDPNYDSVKIMKTLELFYISRQITDYNIVKSSFVDKINLYNLLEKEFFLNPIMVY